MATYKPNRNRTLTSFSKMAFTTVDENGNVKIIMEIGSDGQSIPQTNKQSALRLKAR